MLERMAAHWWMLLLRGNLALALGLFAFAVPGATAYALAIIFATFALFDGIGAIVAAVRMKHADGKWGWLLSGGILSVLFGLVAVVFPGIALLSLDLLIAAWAILTGIAEIVTAWRLRAAIKGEWLWIRPARSRCSSVSWSASNR